MKIQIRTRLENRKSVGRLKVRMCYFLPYLQPLPLLAWYGLVTAGWHINPNFVSLGINFFVFLVYFKIRILNSVFKVFSPVFVFIVQINYKKKNPKPKPNQTLALVNHNLFYPLDLSGGIEDGMSYTMDELPRFLQLNVSKIETFLPQGLSIS